MQFYKHLWQKALGGILFYEHVVVVFICDVQSPDFGAAEDMDQKFQPSSPPEIRSFYLQQTLTSDMAPKARLLVYMVTEDGEVAADAIDIDIEQCHQNHVSNEGFWLIT